MITTTPTKVTLFDDLPDSVILDQIMIFLGPLDLIQNLGSTSKRFRKLAKSDMIWQEFCRWRTYHSNTFLAMVLELRKVKDGSQADCDGMMVVFDGDDDHDDHDHDHEALEWTYEEEEDDMFYDERCADSELRKIHAWLTKFDQASLNPNAYENYRKLHRAGWPCADHNLREEPLVCSQAPDPVAQADRMDGAYFNIDDIRCNRQPTVHCRWAGCLVGYCQEHKKKQEWDEVNLIQVDKWNECSFCGLELCTECNVKTEDYVDVLRWIEPVCNSCNKAACMDCRKNTLGSLSDHQMCDCCTNYFCSECSEHAWTIVPEGPLENWKALPLEFREIDSETSKCFCSFKCADLVSATRNSEAKVVALRL